jgi:hypothetical protein
MIPPHELLLLVIPAKAGIQRLCSRPPVVEGHWMVRRSSAKSPAFAGMTALNKI